MYQNQARYDEALKAFARALAIEEKTLGPDHPDVAHMLNNIAFAQVAQGDWARATDSWQRATAILERRTVLRAEAPVVSGKGKGETTRNSGYFAGLIKAAWRGVGKGHADRASTDGLFLKAQWALASDAAEAVAQMASRSAKGDSKLGRLVRERQDLVAEWQHRDQARTAAVAQSPDKRSKDTEAQNVARLNALEARVGAIDTTLKEAFPEYAALASPTPTSIEDVQTQLSGDEALILTLDTDARFKPLPEETFVWVVTKTDVRWVRSQIGTVALQREVAALRCGLDGSAWDGDGGSRCEGLLATKLERNAPLPFDLARAYALYQGLFGEVDALIKDKHLLIVPSGALNALPFQVLVTEKPTGAIPKSFVGYAAAQWLGARSAVTILPAVSSLKALRSHASPSRADQPYIGFGNPLLVGKSGTDRSAFERQRCPEISARERVRLVLNGVAPALASLMRGGLGEVEALRRQQPLPETADELCAVARSRGLSDPDQVVNLEHDQLISKHSPSS